MSTLYTLGSQGKTLAEFIACLRRAGVDDGVDARVDAGVDARVDAGVEDGVDDGVDAVIDIRLHNTSQLAGYTKRDDLAFLLREGFGIAYEHRLELAPTAEILEAYRQDQDWPAYQARFLPLLAERHAENAGREILVRYHAPCLLCSEAVADHCHRRLVAEYWADSMKELTIVHL